MQTRTERAAAEPRGTTSESDVMRPRTDSTGDDGQVRDNKGRKKKRNEKEPRKRRKKERGRCSESGICLYQREARLGRQYQTVHQRHRACVLCKPFHPSAWKGLSPVSHPDTQSPFSNACYMLRMLLPMKNCSAQLLQSGLWSN